MKTFLILFAFLPFLASAQPCTVTMHVTAPGVMPDESVYIAGNMPQLGNWAPADIKLERVTDSTFSASFVFPKGTMLEYKFTRGAWNKEAIFEQGKIPQNFTLTVSQSGTIKYSIPTWRDQSTGVVARGQITGKVEYLPRVQGPGILPRDVIVWLPPDYDTDTTARYPVLYMHDGQNLFDPSTSSFGIDWQVDECADSLIKKHFISPIIIVGINNSSDRYYDYSPGEKGTAYMNFLVTVLKPVIDKKYRTIPDRKHTATAGSSMGGLISFMLVWEYDEIFSQAACFSPAFKYRGCDYPNNVREYDGPKKDIRVYIDNGGIGLEAQLQEGIDDMLEALRKKGYHQGLDQVDLMYVKDELAEHNEAAWAKRVHFPLLFFFGN